MKNFPSIFNEVIGPVMRGPSSSHTAASWRIGKMALNILNDDLSSAIIEFDKEGAWATNFREQGSVLGMTGALVGIEMTDEKMKHSQTIAKDRNIDITYQVNSFENDHPNSMQVRLQGRTGNSVLILAVSLGGGSFEIRKIDDYSVKIKGDLFESLIWSGENIVNDLKNILPDHVDLFTKVDSNAYFYILKSSYPFDNSVIEKLGSIKKVKRAAYILPVMPVISGKQKALPFSSVRTLIKYATEKKLSSGELGMIYESCRSGLSDEELFSKMSNLIQIIEGSIKIGLEGTKHDDRILEQQSHLIDKADREGLLLQNSIINKIVKNVSAIMESKSALEVIVANPTAGSCGTVGGVLDAVAESINADKNDKVSAYFAAGLIGAYFADGPGFSAEEHGCQVECGAASGMAAAGIVQLMGGTAEQAIGAASFAIQNMIGLVCDPIADRVEAPCLGKNVSAAVNALSSATMSMAGFLHLIPLDQVLETVKRVSADMPNSVKCTGLGGLAITEEAQKIKEELAGRFTKNR